MSVKQISVFLENKPGALYAMTGVLAQHKVDMRAFSLAETSDFGIARMIVSDIYAATTILREAGYVHSISEVLAVSVPDVPGGLNKILHVLTDAGVNVEYMYVFPGSAGSSAGYPRCRSGPDRPENRAGQPGRDRAGVTGSTLQIENISEKPLTISNYLI